MVDFHIPSEFVAEHYKLSSFGAAIVIHMLCLLMSYYIVWTTTLAGRFTLSYNRFIQISYCFYIQPNRIILKANWING